MAIAPLRLELLVANLLLFHVLFYNLWFIVYVCLFNYNDLNSFYFVHLSEAIKATATVIGPTMTV